jgi:hypothetical protein
VNTFYYADGGAALSPTTEAVLGTGWLGSIGVAFMAAISSDYLMQTVKVQCLTTPTRMPAIGVVNVAAGGPAGHEPLTVGVTIQRLTGIKGQSGRGRITVPAVPTAWVTNSVLTSTALHTALAAAIGTGFVAGGVTYTAQLASRGNRKGPSLGASPILTTRLDLVLGSARRRKINRG